MLNSSNFQIKSMKKTVVIALGGNALSQKNEAGTIEQQFKHTRDSLKSVMHFVKAGYNICITHGNGPQVGAELSRNEISMDIIPPLPLNVLVANTQGAIGYMIQQSLQNALYNEDSPPKIMSVGLHCRLIGKPGRIQSLKRFLDYVSKHKDVWICKRMDIADYWIKNFSN